MEMQTSTIFLKSGLSIGGQSPIRVNCNIGCNNEREYLLEIEKLKALKSQNVLPDMMMDLSMVKLNTPLYIYVRDELNLPFGTVLSYHGFSKKSGLSWPSLRDEFIGLCNAGLSFITIHFTSDVELNERAKKQRIIPMTSRGGGIVLYDMILNARKENIFASHIDDLAEIALRYDVVISLGTTFRPGTIIDACDEIHLEETKRQLKVCNYLKSKGVKVMVENVGHISLDKLYRHEELLSQFNSPIMPLGPLPTDIAIDQDHIANAIGSSVSAYRGITHIINCVTRYEHSHSNITLEATIEAIKTARLAAHIANLSKGVPEAINEDIKVSLKRGSIHNCFSDGSVCSRCSSVCPLKLV